ncbi:MAG: S-layer homology domain-containing protein [Terriglobia bacterium]
MCKPFDVSLWMLLAASTALYAQKSAPAPATGETLTGELPATYPAGQAEVMVAPRGSATQPLLFSFVTDQSGFDTEFTISNTSQDTQGSTPVGGTCSISYYSDGAPVGAQTSASISPGKQLIFTLSQGGGGIGPAGLFQGYVIANCSFPLARGSARVYYVANQAATNSLESAQAIALPRSTPSSQTFLVPYLTNQGGYETGIAIANTTADPFGASGATPTGGACTVNFYGSVATTPVVTPNIPAGTVYAVTLTNLLGISASNPATLAGYAIVQCNFGSVSPFVYLTRNFPSSSAFLLPVPTETLTYPRSSSVQPMLFPAITNANGNDTGVVIANTTSDPTNGLVKQGGTCTLNFYGSNAPAPFVTPNVPTGTVYSTTLSAVAPGFQGYATASCVFPAARGYSFVTPNNLLNALTTSYSEIPEVVSVPRTTGASSLLLTSVTNWSSLNDTNVTISNTSLDSFGTSAGNGSCTISYLGAMSGGGNPPAASVSTVILAGGQLTFSLSKGNPAQGIPAAAGFRGYLIADCGFPLARGISAVSGTPGGVIITASTLPAGTAGTGYSQLLKAVNGVLPYQNWAVTSGSLPSGLMLDASTGLISGRPATSVGSPFNFTVTVQDSPGNVSGARSLAIAVAPAVAPVISGVINSASQVSGTVAPGSLASLYASSMGAGLVASSTVPWPTSLASTTVNVNGQLAPLHFVSSDEINFQVPYGTPTGAAGVTVTYSGTASSSFPITVVPASPGLLTQFDSGPSAIATYPDFTINSSGSPAPAGAVLSVYFTGVGIVNPAVADGASAPASPASNAVASTSATVGGVGATINFIGRATAGEFSLLSGNVGVDVTRIQIPIGLTAGSYPVRVTANGVTSNAAIIYVAGTLTAQSITFAALGNQSLNTSPVTLTASSSSGLAVSFMSTTTSVCTVSGNMLTILAAGGCSIKASQPGNATYAQAPPVVQSFTVMFGDVAPTDYFFKAVNLMAQKGITAGCGSNSYCPEQLVTRSQMAIFMVRAIQGGDSFTSSSTPYFTDVQPSYYAFRWIQRMKELGITGGCAAGLYCPEQLVTRSQMAIFLIRARLGVNLAGAPPTFTYPATAYFADEPDTDSVFPWVQRMKLESITGGCSANAYCPGAVVTRGDMSIFIMRGAFNQLLPAGTPVVSQMAPATLARGAPGTFTITGLNTNFVQGTTQVSPLPGVTIGTVTVNSATSLTVQLTADVNAVAKPYSILAITGSEQAVLPNGLTLQ